MAGATQSLPLVLAPGVVSCRPVRSTGPSYRHGVIKIGGAQPGANSHTSSARKQDTGGRNPLRGDAAVCVERA